MACVQHVFAQSADPGLPAHHGTSFSPSNMVSRPAVLPQVKSPLAGVQAFEQFMLKELRAYTLFAVIPSATGAFGCLLMSSGSVLYGAQRYGLAYGRSLGEKLNIGLGFDYFSERAQGYEKMQSVAVNGGLLVHLTRQVHAGFHLFYPVDVWLPLQYLAGLAYDASQQCRLNIELRKTGDAPPVAACSLEYSPLRQFSCMIGVATQPQLHYMGIVCRKGQISAGVTGSYHPQLGITPNLMIVWQQKPE